MSVCWEDLISHTDFISAEQELLVWGFEIDEMERAYVTGFYSLPVEDALCAAFMKMNDSKNAALRGCCFTVFLGDAVIGSNIFCIGVRSSLPLKAVELIAERMEKVEGYRFTEFGSMPHLPLVPKFRYERGSVFEYGESDLAGSLNVARSERAGFDIRWRNSESASLNGGRERYCDEAS